jgi:hypothetical protein
MAQNICEKCHGTGRCAACAGTGMFKPVAKAATDKAESANLCASCFGSGVCRYCGGCEGGRASA